MNFILFGPPGAGKGTQAQKLVKKYDYLQISTGDLLRSETKTNSELGNKIENLISNGQFVSDEIVFKLLEKKISELTHKNKIIFDGYPRTINQSKDLNKLLNNYNEKIDLVISLNVPREIVEKRIMGRITCEKCNITLNEYFDKERITQLDCKGKYLVKRKDDNAETVLARYDKYIETTKPVLDFLSNSISVHQIDGTLKIDEITRKIDDILGV